MKRKTLVLALVALALGIQTLAAVHAPGVHEEPVSACAEGMSHFCAEDVPSDAGPCLLCQISASGIVDLRADSFSLSFETAPVALLRAAPGRVSSPVPAHSPRAPPVG